MKISVKGIYVILVLLWCTALTSFGQTNQITIPEPVLRSAYTHGKSRFDKTYDKLKRSELKKEAKGLEEFYIESNYSLSLLLRSGKILVDDTLNSYVNSVGTNIISTNKIKKKFDFLILKSAYINAFCTEDGVVIVTTGLLSVLENESELAFILCHEIAHFLKDHVLKRVINKMQLSLKEASNGMLDEKSALTKTHIYARKQEVEADSVGLVLFANTPYNSVGALGALNKLKNNYSAFEGKPFDIAFITTDELNFDSLITISPDGKPLIIEESDSLTTHPHIDDRIAFAQDFLKNIATNGKVNLIEEQTLLRIKLLATYAYIEELIFKGALPQALYATYFLSISEKQDKYWRLLKSKVLYELFRTVNEASLNKAWKFTGQKNADLVALDSLFKNLPEIAVSYLSAQLIFNEFEKYKHPEIEYLTELTASTILSNKKTFRVYLSKEISFFRAYEISNDFGDFKLDGLKTLKKKVKGDFDKLLPDLPKSLDGKSTLDSIKKSTPIDYSEYFYNYNKDILWVAFLSLSNPDPNKIFKTVKEPYNKTIVLNPSHFYFRGAKLDKLRFDYKKTDAKTNSFSEEINFIKPYCKKELIVLSPNTMEPNSILEYELYAAINEITYRAFVLDNYSNPNRFKELKITENAESQTVLIPIVLTADIAITREDASMAFITAIFPFFLPIGINGLIRDSGYSKIFLFEYNLATGNMALVKSKFCYNKIYNSEINNFIYTYIQNKN